MSTIADQLAKTRQKSNSDHEDKENKKIFQQLVPGWKLTNLDDPNNFVYLACFRVVLAFISAYNSIHPDEYWQVTQVAYDWVYGGVDLPWEFDKAYRLRNVIFPAFIAIPMYLLKLANLDSNLVIRLAPYFTHLLLVVLNDLFIWKIGKKVVGVDATRFAMFFIVTNQFQI